MEAFPPTLPAAGSMSSASNAPLPPMDVPQVVPPSPAPTVQDPNLPSQDLPLRLIGLAMSLPNSSYFSNYEVFIAERRISKGKTELIKLVYVFLPYQKRLSQYLLGSSRIYKLRVTRDESCDESLMQLTWPDADENPLATKPANRNNLLPCYRMTADDYRRAQSRPR
jgi:hypothetical protein